MQSLPPMDMAANSPPILSAAVAVILNPGETKLVTFSSKDGRSLHIFEAAIKTGSFSDLLSVVFGPRSKEGPESRLTPNSKFNLPKVWSQWPVLQAG